MVDIENAVFTKVKTALTKQFPNITVESVTTYSPSKFPFVCIEEADNYSYLPTRDTSTSWSSYATIGGVESGSSSFSFDNDSWITLSSANAYYVQLEVSDKLSTNTITLYINKGQPLVAFRTEKVGINTNDPQSALDVNGNITMNGQIVQGFVGEVGTGVSLNDVTASGIYYASWVNSTQSESNYPASNYGVLEVISPFSYFVMQRYTSNSGSVYVRVKLNNDWTAWKQVTT